MNNKNYTIMEDNVPKTVYFEKGETVIDDAKFTDLPKDEQKKVLAYIKESFVPMSKACKDYGAYQLKDAPYDVLGIYMTHNQFKHAMLTAGFKPVHTDDYEWFFRISAKSAAIKHFKRW